MSLAGRYLSSEAFTIKRRSKHLSPLTLNLLVLSPKTNPVSASKPSFAVVTKLMSAIEGPPDK